MPSLIGCRLRQLPNLGLFIFLIVIVSPQTDTLLVAAQTPSPSTSSGPSGNSGSVSLQGKLVLVTSQPNGTWLIEGGDGNTYFLPAQPVNPASGALLGPGRWLAITCFVDYRVLTTVVCSRIIVRNVLSTSVERPISSGVQLRVLIVVISMGNSTSCGMQTGANANDVYNAFMSQPDGFADFFNNCSYGKMVFDRETFTVTSVEIPVLSTTHCYPSYSTCEIAYKPISDAAQERLPPEVIGINYSHMVYVLPNVFNGCPWEGKATLPGKQSWFPPKKTGIFAKGVVMQEIIHNFGLYHGWSNSGVEYNDFTTAMGKGSSCPSAPELLRLDWASPLVELNSANLPPNTYSSYTLPATSVDSEGVMIKIKPDWLGIDYMVNVYLSFRVKEAGDKDLSPAYIGKVIFHELNKDVDNSYSSVSDPRVTFRRTGGPNEDVRFNYNLYFSIGKIVNDGYGIQFKVCRFTQDPKYCRAINAPLFPPKPSRPPPFPSNPPASPPPRKPLSPPRQPRFPSPRKSPPPPPSPPRPPPPSPPPRPPPPSPAPPRPPPPSPAPPRPPPPSPPPRPPPPSPASPRRSSSSPSLSPTRSSPLSPPPPLRPPPTQELDEFPSSSPSRTSSRRSPKPSPSSLHPSPRPYSSPNKKHSRPLAGKRTKQPSPLPSPPPRSTRKPSSLRRGRSSSAAGSTETQ